jgi:hypothetical protein
MLKWLAVVTAFLAVAQTAAPIPRQAPDHPANANQNSANQNPVIPQPIQTVKEQYDGSTEAGENKPQPIAIREFPPVSLTKDWTDRSYWIFSGLLVLVGGFQVWLSWRTLRALKRQAKDTKESNAQTFAILKEQTDNLLISAKAATVIALATEESAKAAQKSADALVSAERAWVIASILKTASPFPFKSHLNFPEVVKCELMFKNYGATPAIIETFSCQTRWTLPPVPFPPDPEYGENHDARFILAPGEEKSIGTVFPVEEFPDFRVERAFFIGYVTYGGIFEGQRKTAFCFGFDESLNTFIPIGPSSYNDAT